MIRGAVEIVSHVKSAEEGGGMFGRISPLIDEIQAACICASHTARLSPMVGGADSVAFKAGILCRNDDIGEQWK